MSKYIIKNCPVIQQETCEKYGMCQDCTDCKLKRVVEKCIYCINTEKNNKYKTNGWMLSDDILHLLDVQEVE